MRLIVGFIFLFVFVLSSFAQQYNFVNYSVEHGLIQSQINSLCQDNKGVHMDWDFGRSLKI
jgi:hypothetical protein